MGHMKDKIFNVVKKEEAWRLVQSTRPDLIITSPMCTPFSQLQILNPQNEKSKRKWDEGVAHMKFVVTFYSKQVEEGRVFLYGHLAHSRPWGLNESRKVMAMQGVDVVEADQRMFGFKTKSHGVQTLPAKQTHEVHDELAGYRSRIK